MKSGATPTRRRRTDLLPALSFLLPNFVGFLVFTAVPVFFSLGASFTNWELQHTRPLSWIGVDNYSKLISDPEFWIYFINTIYLMLGMPLAIAGSLLLAVLLSQKLRGVAVYRTLFYLPSFTNGVALMLLWKALYNPDFGPINAVIEWIFRALHVNASAPQWLLSTKNLLGLEVEQLGFTGRQFGLGARDALIMMGIWIAIGGNNMLLYLAALTNVPQELYEAADIDGAGRWQKFWNVTWPQLAPTTFFILIMSFIGGLQGGFEVARVMTGGGPAGTTTTLAYYIYQKAFDEFQMGYASAVSWFLFAIIFAVTLVNWRFGSRMLNE
jgi:multiple sugar transport system permease protein